MRREIPPANKKHDLGVVLCLYNTRAQSGHGTSVEMAAEADAWFHFYSMF
jgi:hypothetical protein